VRVKKKREECEERVKDLCLKKHRRAAGLGRCGVRATPMVHWGEIYTTTYVYGPLAVLSQR